MSPEPAPAGWPLVRRTVAATAVLTVVAVLSAVFHFRDDRTPPHVTVFAVANIVVSLTLFAAGCLMFAVGFLRAIGRSRTSQIEFSSLFFLAGSTAPARVKRVLLGAYAVQLLVAVGTAAARPLTDQAFVIMAPMCAQGALALWGGTYGAFPGRADDRPAGTRTTAAGEPESETLRPDQKPPAPAPARRARSGARGGPRPRPRR